MLRVLEKEVVEKQIWKAERKRNILNIRRVT